MSFIASEWLSADYLTLNKTIMDPKLHPTYSFFLFLLIFLLPTSVQAQDSDWETLAEIPENIVFPVVGTIDGKIHLVNATQNDNNNAHFRYDPVTNTWETLASLPYPAQMAAGTVADGKLHVFGGGYPNSGSPVGDHYIYDPATDVWTEAAPLDPPRAIHYGVTVGSDVYCVSGQGVDESIERYDADSDSWEQLANMPVAFNAYYGLESYEDKIYRFGGGTYAYPVDDALVYDTNADDWTSVSPLSQEIHGLAAARIEGTDQIYLIGGLANLIDLDQVIVYDISDDEYFDAPALPVGRTYHVATALDGCIYSLGGNHAVFELGQEMLRYCPPQLNVGIQEDVFGDIEVLRLGNALRVQAPSDFDRLGELQLSVHSLDGKLLYANPLRQSITDIDTQSWATGMVLVTLELEGVNTVRQMTVNH